MPDVNLKMNPEKEYKEEFELAKEILAPYGGELFWNIHRSGLFEFKNKQVNLVFYKHKTSAGNYHIRVKVQVGLNSNKQEAEKLMKLLDRKSGYNCTFSRKWG